MARPRVSLGALMSGVAMFALTLGFGMPLVRSVVAFSPEVTRLLLVKLGVIALNIQILYWFFLVPLVRWLRRER